MNNVNSLSMDNVSHAQAVAALKRAGKRVELTVKRKAVVKVIIIIQNMIIDMISIGKIKIFFHFSDDNVDSFKYINFRLE